MLFVEHQTLNDFSVVLSVVLNVVYLVYVFIHSYKCYTLGSLMQKELFGIPQQIAIERSV